MKPKVYLDTSVISHLAHEDAPEKMAATRELWRLFQDGQFDIALSVTTLYELDKCPEPPRSTLFDYLAQINYETYEMTFAVESIADLVLSMGILRKKSYDDCLHIAFAIANECDYIVSWNFKHIVNAKTIFGIRELSDLGGLRPIKIVSPNVLIERSEF